MGLRITALLIMISLSMCFGTSYKSNIITTNMKFGQEEHAQEDVDITPELTDIFYVNFEIIVFQHEIDEYPITWENFQRAMDEWSDHIPVRWIIFFEDNSNEFSILGRIGAIKIHLADLQEEPYHLSDKLLGVWHARGGSILLDADALEDNPERAYSVSLHEIGHMFGVPHIISFSEIGYTGFIVLPVGHDAKNYVMYSRAIQKHPQKVLSMIEIKLAYQNLVHHWTRPDVIYKEHRCELYIEN